MSVYRSTRLMIFSGRLLLWPETDYCFGELIVSTASKNKEPYLASPNVAMHLFTTHSLSPFRLDFLPLREPPHIPASVAQKLPQKAFHPLSSYCTHPMCALFNALFFVLSGADDSRYYQKWQNNQKSGFVAHFVHRARCLVKA